MSKFIVEYCFQGDFMAEEDYGTTVVDADNEAAAVSKVEREGRLCHTGVIKVTPCEKEETDWVVDLCVGNITVATFVVKEYFPVSDQAQGTAYFAMLSCARAKAYEIIARDYPEFVQKLNDRSISENEKESMVIVRPKRWIQEGEKAWTVTIFYKPNKYSSWHGKDSSWHFIDVLAADPEQARLKGIKKAKGCILGSILSTSVKRTAEHPSVRAR